MKVEKLDHIHVYCRDPEASVAFYRDHFEAAEVLRNQDAQGQPTIFLALGGQLLYITAFPAGMSPANPPIPGDGAYTHGFGIAHFGLRVLDVEAAVRELADAGVRVLGGPTQDDNLVYAYIEAPDGVVVELTQYEIG